MQIEKWKDLLLFSSELKVDRFDMICIIFARRALTTKNEIQYKRPRVKPAVRRIAALCDARKLPRPAGTPSERGTAKRSGAKRRKGFSLLMLSAISLQLSAKLQASDSFF